MDKKITLIIPVYNQVEKLLRSCLSSVRADILCHNDMEVIVIDDGSDNGSEKICDEYSDDFTIYHTENRGVSVARNLGIERANGEYICFLDSDDEWIPGAFSALKSKLDKEFPVAQYNHFRYYEKSGRVAMKYRSHEQVYTVKNLRTLPAGWCYVWNKVFLKSFIIDNGIRFLPGMQFGEDELFSLQAILIAGKVRSYGDGLICRHFSNKNSLVHIVTKEQLDKQIEILEKFRDYVGDPAYMKIIQDLIEEHKKSGFRKKVQKCLNKIQAN